MQDSKGPLYIATPYATRLDEIATATFRAAPDDLARLGFAVANALDPRAPSAADFPLAAEIARALKSAKKPLVISGMSCASEAVMEAAANAAMAAANYKARGWKPVPVPFGEKRPRGNGWQNRNYDPARDFAGAMNVGGSTGVLIRYAELRTKCAKALISRMH